MATAIFGFVGVLLGSLTTLLAAIYKERVTDRREAALRDVVHERERLSTRNAFQRDSVLALQSAVTDVIQSAYAELDRVIAAERETGTWPARQWATPTAEGWSQAILALESARARVFDDELRRRADELRTRAGESVWADSHATAQRTSEPLERLLTEFHDVVNRTLPSLY
ncbi:hypothetical protein ACFWNN_09495 [Lentzea sp. NPDC058450]|uniref:hypothetical protein n=1 Tax=Lentzea sp. NPDC058450 TaxID=3346505 RepID=UPI003650BA80